MSKTTSASFARQLPLFIYQLRDKLLKIPSCNCICFIYISDALIGSSFYSCYASLFDSENKSAHHIAVRFALLFALSAFRAVSEVVSPLQWVKNGRQALIIAPNESHGLSGAFGTGPVAKKQAKLSQNSRSSAPGRPVHLTHR